MPYIYVNKKSRHGFALGIVADSPEVGETHRGLAANSPTRQQSYYICDTNK